MVFVTVPSVSVGDSLKKELFDLYKANFDNHELRLLAQEAGGGKLSIINSDIHIGSSGLLTGIYHYEVIQACIITECAFQLFEKVASGTLTVDIKKNTTTNPAGFNSIMTTAPTIAMASASNYQRVSGVINTGLNSLSAGDIIRVDVTSLPIGMSKFRVIVKAEF